MKISIYKLKIIFAIFLLVFGIVGRVGAQELESNLPQASESSKVDSNKKIDYTLSYPGILPDNPIYFLKAARDRIVAFFISNPSKKADFNLLQADKRVLASLFLVQKGKNDLAKNTFSKAENYFEDAFDRTSDARSQGMSTLELANKLVMANRKHQEVFSDIQKTFSSKDKQKWEKERVRLKELEKKVGSLSK